jgi:hypothetical protein
MEYEVARDESVTTAVVRAVSSAVGLEPRALPPLAHVVDPDALNALCGSRAGGEPRRGGRFSFLYSYCRVTVDNGEYLTIELLENCPIRRPEPSGAGPRDRPVR